MGNFHCIPEGCGRVVYREYLPPSIRYRYEDEDWKYVDGDDYQLNELEPECPGANYQFVYGRQNRNANYGNCYATTRFQMRPATIPADWMPVSNLRIVMKNYDYEVNYADPMSINNIFDFWCDYPSYASPQIYFYVTDKNGIERYVGYIQGNGYFFDEIRVHPNDVNKCLPPKCEFKVFKNSTVVHTETRDRCPEVEKLDCRLSNEQKEIKIEKLSYLEGIEIVNFARDAFSVSNKAEIPNHCLNIYKTSLQRSIIPIPDYYFDYDYISQICSTPGCPPPEYHVECNCDDCEECPPDTCAIRCDGHICCYDDYGRAIKEIAIENYCGGAV